MSCELRTLPFFSGQRLLEEFETHLKDEEGRCDKAHNKLDKSSKILVDAKSGVDHLSEKLKHLKVVKTSNPSRCLKLLRCVCWVIICYVLAIESSGKIENLADVGRVGSGPTVGVRGEAAEGSGRSGPKIRKRFGGHQQGDERGRGMYMYCTWLYKF